MAGLLTGIGGSGGYGSGKAVVKTSLSFELSRTAISDTSAEIAKFRSAQNAYTERLARIAEEAERTAGPEVSGIFRAYQWLTADENFFKGAISLVERENVNIEYAVDRECDRILGFFDSMEDDYMKERATDIKNVCAELIRIMLGISHDFSPMVEEKRGGVILVADNLTPTETVRLDKRVLRGIITEHGGVTSHTVILAKALRIPAVVGVENALETVREGDYIQMDAFSGKVYVNPGRESRRTFASLKESFENRRKLFRLAEREPAVTRDGFAVKVRVNTGDPAGVRAFDASRCDGVGLFRTEFIYMDKSDYPSEREQFEIYRRIAERAKGKEVTFRTLDVSGEKSASYMKLPVEENPVLGYRGIRFCLGRRDVFAVQLRAILRASVFGSVKVMFPMISCIDELLEAKECLEAEKKKLRGEGIAFREDIPVGVLIETPAAVLISDKLAAHSDFFSVGTNDLIQYTTATDRMNERVQKLCDCFEVSVIRSIRMTAENASRAGIPWGICGEAASESLLVPLWVAIGAGELSVSPSHVGEVKHTINSMSRSMVQKEIEAVLRLDRADEVRSYMEALLGSMED